VRHTLVALLQDRPGVLHRAVSLLRRRAFNIESLAVGHSEAPGVSRMTLVVDADDVQQVVKQLYRLIEVLKVTDVTNGPTVEREAALLKVHAPTARRSEIMALANAFEAKVVDVGASTVVLEVTGSPGKVDKLAELTRRFGLKELVRTGRIVMTRGSQAVQPPGREKEHGGAGGDRDADGATPATAWAWQADGSA